MARSAVTHAFKLVGALLIALTWLPFAACAQSTGKIGYVDLKRLLDNAPQMIDSRAKLEQEFASRDAVLKTDESKLATLKQRLTRDGAIMSASDADSLKREIDALERANKRTREDLRNELNTRAAAERDRAWQQIQDKVAEYAHEQGFDLIVPGPVVYFTARVDVTDAVLDKLKHAKPAAAGAH